METLVIKSEPVFDFHSPGLSAIELDTFNVEHTCFSFFACDVSGSPMCGEETLIYLSFGFIC